MWKAVFYIDDNGAKPVREFLDDLDIVTKLRFSWSIEKVCERSVRTREPLVHHLENGLWEIPEESDTDNYGLIYFLFSGQRVVFLHGFLRGDQSALWREIEIALERLDSFLKREADGA